MSRFIIKNKGLSRFLEGESEIYKDPDHEYVLLDDDLNYTHFDTCSDISCDSTATNTTKTNNTSDFFENDKKNFTFTETVTNFIQAYTKSESNSSNSSNVDNINIDWLDSEVDLISEIESVDNSNMTDFGNEEDHERELLDEHLHRPITKSAKRNQRKKLARYAYKAKLEVLVNQTKGKEATIISNNDTDSDFRIDEEPTINPNIRDNSNDGKAEIFYNPERHKTQIETRKSTKKDTVNYIRSQWVSEDFDAEDLKSTNLSQPSTIVSPRSTFIEKFLEKRCERRIANQVPIDDISSIPAKYIKLLEAEIFHEPNVSESIPQNLWNEFGQWACFNKDGIKKRDKKLQKYSPPKLVPRDFSKLKNHRRSHLDLEPEEEDYPLSTKDLDGIISGECQFFNVNISNK
ncbi:7952_t:CDS:2 [Ambispora leptoticha]|uniref:7952_t:CDS:1 n=1 Tax=Ambispora leptoticha TaxID=144679 RepID=A0A9N8W146_9GLOM|nr:7952_t:CDS:2 [Ambispora leptoticha]